MSYGKSSLLNGYGPRFERPERKVGINKKAFISALRSLG